VDLSVVTNGVILSGLVGAIVWDLLTWWWGLPTSSSHALIGGYAGAAVAKAGFGAILIAGWTKTLVFIVLAPMLGLVLGLLIMSGLYSIVGSWMPARVNRVFRRFQLVSAALYSLGHGSNDALKTLVIIAGVLVTGGYLQEFSIPIWVILAAHAAIALGTLSGGWRIVHTMGQRVTRLQPIGGFAAETSGAITLFLASKLGIPVSTTHTITGAIVGVGATRRLSAVRWGVAGRIVWAWVLTIPCSALIAAVTFLLVRGLVP
jgi:PiT family inorganic phosphate transporter